LEILEKIALAVPAVKFPQDQYADGTTGPWQDICPFSFLAFLNRQFKIENRIAIAETMAHEFDITSPVPASFEGIPTMLHQSAWFFSYADQRHPDDIDKLWDLFEAILDWADETVVKGDALEESFNEVISIKGIKWNITIGMYWARPWSFMPLDAKSRNYLERHLRINVGAGDETKVINGNSLISLINALKSRFEDKQFPAHSFPELSHKAYLADYIDDDEEGLVNTELPKIEATEIYSIENILNEGSFIEKGLLTEFLSVWKDKKNLILQGPPGTGKTWLAKRLGYALMNEKSKSRLVSMQFHSNLSYEDFVRGFRPTKNKELELVNGPFLEMIDRASSDPENKYVFVIEEINRGNPAQIFGELLTLLEKDKRNPEEALQITYKQGDELLYIPENLYVIGTMNLADKSLALMDFALRRRFAFIDLSPNLNDQWHSYVTKELELESNFAKKLKKAVENLNYEISADPNLGEAFQLGHSFFIPSKGLKDNQLACKWFDGVVETEIKPTLKEYWFDNPKKVEKAIESLKNSVIY
jgi:5-methylcytosine-specific restriction protein B